MSKLIKFAVMLLWMCGVSDIALADRPIIGTGLSAQGYEYQADQIERLTTPRLVVPQLTGRFVTQPVTVRPRGPAALGVGNVAINQGAAAGSMIKVKCSFPGQQVFVHGNVVINNGLVAGVAGGSTGMMVITCPSGATTVDMRGNLFVNNGEIVGR